MARQRLTLPEAAEELGVHYMTAYRYVRTGRLPAKRVGGAWEIDPQDLRLVRPSGPGVRRRPPNGPAPSGPGLQARLVAGDEAGAWTLLEAALASKMTAADLLLELIAPTLRAIGTRWERGELSVADEHRASAVATRLISRLGARFARRGVKRGTVVLAAAPGELHALPIAIAANLLRWQGFDVVELGADTPAEALAEAAAGEPELVAVGIACTYGDGGRSIRRAVALVHGACPGIPVLLGGAAIADQEHARKLGADLFTGAQADEVVRAVETIVAAKR
ncbi:MAG TPA: B12-binding domain-containing protein [Solirubrobacteraceae bacterium]|nr:B12-binding domain-containing protein [Solirubrobacteraceae bacterium]